MIVVYVLTGLLLYFCYQSLALGTEIWYINSTIVSITLSVWSSIFTFLPLEIFHHLFLGKQVQVVGTLVTDIPNDICWNIMYVCWVIVPFVMGVYFRIADNMKWFLQHWDIMAFITREPVWVYVMYYWVCFGVSLCLVMEILLLSFYSASIIGPIFYADHFINKISRNISYIFMLWKMSTFVFHVAWVEK